MIQQIGLKIKKMIQKSEKNSKVQEGSLVGRY